MPTKLKRKPKAPSKNFRHSVVGTLFAAPNSQKVVGEVDKVRFGFRFRVLGFRV